MSERTDDLYALIVEIRRSFNALKTYSDRSNDDIGVTAAMRAVMEYLAQQGPTSVADIARGKDVSRQHIQQLADQLAKTGLIGWQPNPRHKRSPLAGLTGEGERRFSEIKQREARILDELATALPDTDFEQARHSLAALRQSIGQVKG